MDNSYVKSVSEYGLFQDLRTVGTNPNTSAALINMTDHTGCFTTSHKKREVSDITTIWNITANRQNHCSNADYDLIHLI